MIWIITFLLFASWFIGKVFLGKSGFIHILLLCAIATGLVQLVAYYRSAQQ